MSRHSAILCHAAKSTFAGLTLAGLIVAASFGAAVAGPDRFSVLLGSKHVGGAGFEEVNPGIFLTWDNAFEAFGQPIGLNLGVFRNSYGRPGMAATASLPIFQRGSFDLGLFGGTALYPVDGRRFAVHVGDFVPIAGLQARWGNAFVQVIPSDGKPVQAIVSFGLTFKLDKSR